MHTGKFVFLSRPRRFGKSLLTTPLQELFRGNKALFTGLWIEDKIDWQPRPVILINFNDLNYLEFPLATALDEYMDRLAHEHGIEELTATDYKTKFQELITRLSQQAKVSQNMVRSPSSPILITCLISRSIQDLQRYYEVEQAFQQHLLADYLGDAAQQLSSSLLARLQKALRSQNSEGFINVLKSVFAGILHTLFLTQEAYYHSLVYLRLKLLGFTIHAEPLTNLGRIDAVLELAEVVYILEFKMSTARIALDQIRAKQYELPYRNSGKPIILLGIAFDPAQRNVADWQMERVI